MVSKSAVTNFCRSNIRVQSRHHLLIYHQIGLRAPRTVLNQVSTQIRTVWISYARRKSHVHLPHILPLHGRFTWCLDLGHKRHQYFFKIHRSCPKCILGLCD